MTKVYYSCNEAPRNWGRYFALCNALELDLTQFDVTPKKQTLNRWRVESPRGFAFVLHCDPLFVQGLLKSEGGDKPVLHPDVYEGWKRTEDHARALAAKAIFIKTPLQFSPSPQNRRILEAFSQELAQNVKQAVIWESEGMWSVEDTRTFAESLQLIYAIDPFLADREDIGFTHGDGCFILTERAGLRREFDTYDMEQILQWGEHYNRVFILLRGRFQFNYAKQLRYLLGEE